MAGKSQACNECCHLKIQCFLVPSRVRWGPKCKAESDAEEAREPKWLKLVVKVLGMRVEPMIQEVFLEHLEFLADIWELFAKQLEETKRIWKVMLVIVFTVDELTDQIHGWRREVETETIGQGVFREGCKKIRDVIRNNQKYFFDF